VPPSAQFPRGVIFQNLNVPGSEKTIACTNLNASVIPYVNSIVEVDVIVEDQTFGTGASSSCSKTLEGLKLSSYTVAIDAITYSDKTDIDSCVLTAAGSPTPRQPGDSVAQTAYADATEGTTTNLGLVVGLSVAACVVLTVLIFVIACLVHRRHRRHH